MTLNEDLCYFIQILPSDLVSSSFRRSLCQSVHHLELITIVTFAIRIVEKLVGCDCRMSEGQMSGLTVFFLFCFLLSEWFLVENFINLSNEGQQDRRYKE